MNGVFEPGEVFEGRYRIDGVLGRGGFSIVYDATDIDYERRVALKVVDTQGERYSGPTRARFEREISAVAELDNPHTVEVYEYGSTLDGDLYASFEYIPGRDLSELLDERGRLAPEVVEHILRQLLIALGDAHRAGILHRDLKPENVRVFEHDGDPWRVKLLDFGIARPAGAITSSVTKTGELIGTPRYMSPEQLTDTRLTAASDIYSLGIVAFELLSGRDTSTGNNWSDQLGRLQSGHLYSVDHIPDAQRLRKIVQQMTAFELSDRLCTAQAVLDALGEDPDITVDDHAEDATEFFVSERGTTLVEQTGEPVVTIERAAPRRLGMILGVAALVVISGLVAVALTTRDEPASRPTLPAQLLATQTRTRPLAPTPPAPRQVTSAARDHAERKVEVPAGVPSGCGEAPKFTGRGRLAFTFQLDREPWETYVPKNYDGSRPAPLVILLHDRLQHGGKLLTGSGLEQLADKHGFVIIAPVDRDLLAWLDVADQRLVYEVYDETAAQLCIDRKRVFVVAQGSSGETALPLACEPWVSALATNSYRRSFDTFGCNRPVPMLMMSPLKSRHEPVEGGKNCKGTQQISLAKAEQIWRQRNGCTDESEVVFTDRGSTCRRWACTTPFESCHVDGGRGWPGGPPRRTTDPGCEGEEHQFPTAERVWGFFDALE